MYKRFNNLKFEFSKALYIVNSVTVTREARNLMYKVISALTEHSSKICFIEYPLQLALLVLKVMHK